MPEFDFSNQIREWVLTLWVLTPRNGQTHPYNMSAICHTVIADFFA